MAGCNNNCENNKECCWEKGGILMEKTKVSVLMSIYSKEKAEYFRKSLNSILEQTYLPDEIVLVKDGPLTEELEQVIKEYKNKINMKIVPLEKNRGLGLALREGVLNCSNEIIIRMDTDDIMHSKKIFEQVKIFTEKKDLILVGTNGYDFDKDKNDIISERILPEKNEEILKFSKRRCPFIHAGIGLKKSYVIKAGNYHDCFWFEDYDLFLRMLKLGKGYNIQENLIYIRSNLDVYRRRGGIEYIKKEIKALTKFYKDGSMNLYYYLTNLLLRIVVRICGNNLRKIIYKNFLRKEKND